MGRRPICLQWHPNCLQAATLGRGSCCTWASSALRLGMSERPRTRTPLPDHLGKGPGTAGAQNGRFTNINPRPASPFWRRSLNRDSERGNGRLRRGQRLNHYTTGPEAISDRGPSTRHLEGQAKGSPGVPCVSGHSNASRSQFLQMAPIGSNGMPRGRNACQGVQRRPMASKWNQTGRQGTERNGKLKKE